MNISNILSRILFEKKIKPIELARELHIPQPTMHRIVSGKSPNPHPGSVKPIADYFNLTVDQLKGVAPLPDSFFDNPLAKKRLIEIPLIEWDDLPNLKSPDLKKQSIAAMADLSQDCFAVYMNDSSMEYYFPKRCILILDPNKSFGDRSCVLVKLAASNLHTFRQIIVDADHRFLKPLNPDLTASHMRLLTDEDHIVGVLVEARQVYNNL